MESAVLGTCAVAGYGTEAGQVKEFFESRRIAVLNEKSTVLAEIQKIQLKMLKAVAALCEKYHIRYSIYCGTLLGAVRHKGFIPWDDDIDLSLDRENFNKFIAAAERELPEQYEIVFDTWIRRVTRKDNPKKHRSNRQRIMQDHC